MERGKQVCKILKDIRIKIAQENDIEFITSECTHKGDCAGTCPKCEAEVRYLESQLARRRASGRNMRLAGISLGLAAIAPAFAACDSFVTDGDPVIDGDMGTPEMGYPEVPNNIQLGDNLIFDLIDNNKFMEFFAEGGWGETAIYDVYPDGSLGEEILGRIAGYTPIKIAVKENKVKYYRSYNSDPGVHDYSMMDFVYDGWSNYLRIVQLLDCTVASIDDKEMVCYGPVFSKQWAPEAFLGKYVFTHVDENTVAEWDKLHTEEVK